RGGAFAGAAFLPEAAGVAVALGVADFAAGVALALAGAAFAAALACARFGALAAADVARGVALALLALAVLAAALPAAVLSAGASAAAAFALAAAGVVLEAFFGAGFVAGALAVGLVSLVFGVRAMAPSSRPCRVLPGPHGWRWRRRHALAPEPSTKPRAAQTFPTGARPGPVPRDVCPERFRRDTRLALLP
ncbi:hypothetical protein, partial [Neoroseomonas rubea]|uniref:hypothetical protein n=1 Tax=Neoroseomonas rubea TaxID=2748666 RepID=UPI0018DF7CE7